MPEVAMSQQSSDTIDTCVSIILKSLPISMKCTYLYFGAKFYNTLLNCKLDDDKNLNKDEVTAVQNVMRLINNRNFINKSCILLPIENNGFWFLTVLCNFKMDKQSLLQQNPVLVIMDSNPDADHKNLKSQIQEFAKFVRVIFCQQAYNSIHLKTIHAKVPTNEDPHKSVYFMLRTIAYIIKKPLNVDAKDQLQCKFSLKEVEAMETFVKNSCQPRAMQPVFSKNETCKSAVRCIHCGFYCKNFNKCEKCNRKHLSSGVFQVALNSGSNNMKIEKPEKKTNYSKRGASLMIGAQTTRKSNSVKEEKTTPSVTATVTSKSSKEHNFCRFDFLSDPSPNTSANLKTPSDNDMKKRLRKPKFHEPEILSADDEDSQSFSLFTANLDNMSLFNYPLVPVPGMGRVCLLMSDYGCLKDGECLNDSVIEFYLKYLYFNQWSDQDRKKIHIFNSFFYERLTDVTLSTVPEKEYAQMMHANVKNWTKKVNIFEKEFVIVPINLDFHWIVAIIWFYELKPIPKKSTSLRSSNTSTSKHARIIVFDSMSGSSPRSKNIPGHLQKYLEIEYQQKYQREIPIFRNCVVLFPDVPQQPNGYDCGIFVLQYVESFLKSPIEDFSKPLKNWFSKEEVGDKRKHIADVIKKIMEDQNLPFDKLPNLNFREKIKKHKKKKNSDETNSQESSVDGISTQSKNEVNNEQADTSDENSQVSDIDSQNQNSTSSKVQGSQENIKYSMLRKVMPIQQNINCSPDSQLERKSSSITRKQKKSQTKVEDGRSASEFDVPDALYPQTQKKSAIDSETEKKINSSGPEDTRHFLRSKKSQDFQNSMSKKGIHTNLDDDSKECSGDSGLDSQNIACLPIQRMEKNRSLVNVTANVAANQNNSFSFSSQSSVKNSPKRTVKRLKHKQSELANQITSDEIQTSPSSQINNNVTERPSKKTKLKLQTNNIDIEMHEGETLLPSASNSYNSADEQVQLSCPSSPIFDKKRSRFSPRSSPFRVFIDKNSKIKEANQSINETVSPKKKVKK